jgi:hypothetical protein
LLTFVRFFSLAFFVLPLSASAFASEDAFLFVTHHEATGDFTLDLNFDSLNSASNYDANGSTFTPTSLDHADDLDLRSLLSYGLSDHWSLYGILDLRRSEVSLTSSMGSATHYGFGDQTLGANYRAWQNDRFALDLQLEFAFAAYGNDSGAPTNTEAYLGDGSENLSFGVFAQIPLYSGAVYDLNLKPGTGYTYRSDGYSGDIPFSLRLDYRPETAQTGILASLTLTGALSLNTDCRSPDSQSSYLTHGVNPTLMAVTAEMGRQITPVFEITLNASKSIYGENAPDAYGIGIGVKLRLGSSSSGRAAAPTTPISGDSEVYDLSATVLTTNDSFHLAKIDRGSNEGVQVGDAFEVFGPDGVRIALCRVTNAKPHESALRVEHYYREVWIEKGDMARRRK